MKISVLGIDLAKQVIQLHGVDEQGQTVLRKGTVNLSGSRPVFGFSE